MGRMQREKGKRGEREAAAELAAVFGLTYGIDARRGVQHQGGPESPDVVLQGVSVHVECKRTETINVYKALEQASDDAGEKTPIVWHRRNGKPSVVIVSVGDLVPLARAIVAARAHAATES